MAWQKEMWRPDRSIGEMLQDIVRNVQEIIRSEVRLAKTEITQEASKAARAGAMVGVGAVLGLYAVGFILLTCVYALSIVLAPWLSALIIGVLVAIAAGVAVSAGIKNMKRVSKPEKTIETIRENVQWAKDQTK